MKTKTPLTGHLIFWLFVGAILYFQVFFGREPTTLSSFATKHMFASLINISIFYINYTLLIPLLVKDTKRYGLYVVSIVLLILIMTFCKLGIDSIFSNLFLKVTDEAIKGRYAEVAVYFLLNMFISGFFVVASSLIRFASDWFGNESAQKNLIREKKEMELQFLKSQLNPHFLFNSLNNIYSLAYQKSDKTADAILKLSEIMRYMIYESNDSWVSLSKEIEYLQSFIELQKLRFKDGAAVEFTQNGEIDGQHIVPLILISFVENAFKHGVANDPENPIKINIIANQKILHFSVSNKKNSYNKDQMGGVGLYNVERRLQLLYPDRYKLNIVNSETHYTSELMLDI
ncbi:two-component system LytT family sensor kinase [Pedobacter sp. UYP24]